MEKEFLNRPEKIEDWLNTLSDHEMSLFDAGFATALSSCMELFVDTKSKLLTVVLSLEDGAEKEAMLARIHLLDVFERHYKKRLDIVADSSALM